MAARLILGFCLFAGGVACAADNAGPSPEQEADWQRRLAVAKSLQDKGKELKQQAEADYDLRYKACWEKFRVIDCRLEAKQDMVRATREARRIENEGKEQERQVKKEQLADKDARYLEEAPQREADLRAREAETRDVREKEAAERADKQHAKEAKAAEGSARAAAAEQRRREKQAKHERDVAEKMEKARRREAEAQQ